jgi:hypothetical protein
MPMGNRVWSSRGPFLLMVIVALLILNCFVVVARAAPIPVSSGVELENRDLPFNWMPPDWANHPIWPKQHYQRWEGSAGPTSD